jgi:SAM-dependent methyltransferase
MLICLITCLAGWSMLSSLTLAQAASQETNKPSGQLTIPYVPTRHDVVRDLLWLADVGTNDVVYDLGSGDGRIVISAVRDFGARKAVGIEINPELISESKANAAKAGVSDRVEFIQGDLFTNDFSEASVVVLYLGAQANLDLRSKIFQTLKPGTRVVSHQFGMGEWPPDKELQVRLRHFGMAGRVFNPFAKNPQVPDYDAHHDLWPDGRTISLWIVPAPVAGIWRGKLSLPDGKREFKLVLHQRLSELTGSFQLQAATNYEVAVRAELWGDELRFERDPTDGVGFERPLIFNGHVHGDIMSGRLAIFENNQIGEYQWEGRRAKTDFTGTWEWPGPAGERPVQLQIEQSNQQWVVTYRDQGLEKDEPYDWEKQVDDFYDFGGGFYFSSLIGQSYHGRSNYRRGGGYTISRNDSTGWLIGEGVLDQGSIKGTISFYPYFDGSMLPTNIVIQRGSTNWLPKRVKP